MTMYRLPGVKSTRPAGASPRSLTDRVKTSGKMIGDSVLGTLVEDPYSGDFPTMDEYQRRQGLRQQMGMTYQATGGTDVAGTEGDDDYSAYEQDPDSGEWITGTEAARRRALKAQYPGQPIPSATQGKGGSGAALPYIAPAPWGVAPLDPVGGGNDQVDDPNGRQNWLQEAPAGANNPYSNPDDLGLMTQSSAFKTGLGGAFGGNPYYPFAPEGANKGILGKYSGVQEEKKPDSTLDTILGALKGGANSIVENLPQGQFGNRAARPGEATVQGSSLGEIAPKALSIPDALNPELPNGVGPFIETKVRPFVSDTIQNMRGLNNGAAGYGLGEVQGPKVVSAPVANAIADQIPSRAADTAMLLAPLAGKAVEAAKGLDVAGDLSGAAYRSGIGGGGKFEQEIKAAVNREAAAKAATGATGDATAAAVAEPSPIVQSPVQKLSEALKSAQKATPEQQAMFDQQRSQRTAAAANAMEGGYGKSAYTAAKGALSGEFDRPSFKLPDMAPEDIDALHERVTRAPALQVYDKVNAHGALDDLFSGRIPAPSRLAPLYQAFEGDREFINSVGQMIHKAAPPNIGDYAGEWWMNNVLSNPQGQERNFAGNMASAIMSPVESIAAAAVDKPLSMLQGRPQARFFGEAPAQAVGMARGIMEGGRAALDVFRYGYNPAEIGKADLYQPAFKGWLGRVVRTPTNALEAADQFWYAINYRGTLNQLAYRTARTEGLTGEQALARAGEIMNSPTPEMTKQAAKTAEGQLFRTAPPTAEEVAHGATLSRTDQMTQQMIKLRDTVPGLKYVIPFIRTPVNLTKYGLARSPAGFLNPGLWKNIAAKSPEAADQIGRALIGSSVAAGVAAAVATGQTDITAGVPVNAAERDAFYRDGKQPFSIKIGGHWVGYSQIPALSQTLTGVAAVVQAVRSGQDPTAMAAQVASTIGQELANQTYLSGIKGLMDAISDPANKAETFVTRAAQGFVPASGALGWAARASDPTIRQPDNVKERFEAGIPSLSKNVPPRLDAFGNESQRQTSPYLPIGISKDQTSAVDAELERMGVNVGFVGTSVGGKKLSNEEQADYQRTAGQLTELKLATLFRSQAYQAMSDIDKEKAIETETTNARNKVRDVLLEQYKAKARELLGTK